MGIQGEIFEEFFRKLSEDEAIPSSIIEKLKELLESGEVSQERIFEVIKRGYNDASND
jgi:hypothetical protein